jgi:hypothetical protein
MDASNQKDTFSWSYSKNVHGKTTINTGATFLVCMFPYAGVLQSVRSYAVGLSGAPSLDFKILRFAGGGTSIACSISSMIAVEFGTTGILGYSGLAAAGSTLLLVSPGDILAVQTGVANTSIDSLMLNVVIKKTQDVLSYNGVST